VNRLRSYYDDMVGTNASEALLSVIGLSRVNVKNWSGFMFGGCMITVFLCFSHLYYVDIFAFHCLYKPTVSYAVDFRVDAVPI
jgi:hypothetical protein